MQFVALATDYDGTLAEHGRVDAETLDALDAAEGERPHADPGHRPRARRPQACSRSSTSSTWSSPRTARCSTARDAEEHPIAPEPPPELVETLQTRGVSPLSVGRGIVATWEPHETAVLEAIRELGLELQVIFNKGAVMVLPPGVNKASGLAAALDELGLSPINVVGIGDAENDHAFLTPLRLLGGRRQRARRGQGDRRRRHGRGSRRRRGRDRRQAARQDRAGRAAGAPPPSARAGQRRRARRSARRCRRCADRRLLRASASPRSRPRSSSRLAERGFQFCIADPEGDYEELEGAVVIGDAQRVPAVHEALDLLAAPAFEHRRQHARA